VNSPAEELRGEEVNFVGNFEEKKKKKEK